MIQTLRVTRSSPRRFLSRVATLKTMLRTFLSILILAFASVASSLPEWSDYRSMDDGSRARIDGAVQMIAKKAEGAGFTTKRIRFCANNGKIWETSLNAACTSTENAAHKEAWPPVVTDEGFNFMWVAHMRLAFAYCAANEGYEPCKVLAPVPSTRKSVRQMIFDFMLPRALAIESCKVEGELMVTTTGKKLFLDFGPQPSGRQVALLHKTTALATSDATVESGLLDAFSQLKSMGRVIVANYRAKYPWTINHIRNDKITWISIERTPEELEDQSGLKYAASFDLLKAQIGIKVVKEVAINATTSAACPSAPVCVWLQEKSLRKNIKLLPLQSDTIKTERLGFDRRLQAIEGSLNALSKKGIRQDEIDVVQREYGNMLAVLTPYDLKERDRLKRRYGNADFANAVAGYYDIADAMKKNDVAQERFMATTAITRDGNGILAVSESRKSTFIPMLEATCRGPAEKPPELFTNPSASSTKVAPKARARPASGAASAPIAN